MTTMTAPAAAAPKLELEVTRELAEYATTLRFADLPSPTVEQTKKAILDLLGIAIRASNESGSSAVVRAVVDELGSEGRSTAVGIGARYRPHYAALLNATFAHTLDFDDTHQGGSIHPGAPLIPAALAVAEELGASGERLIAAIAAGYDVTVRIAETALPAAHYDRGFHPTATAGTFGSTAAVAAVARAGSDVLANAFGLNGSQAAGSMQFLENGAWNKRIHTGLTAHNAILAYRLAAAGALGASHPLEGRHGFFHAYSDGVEAARVTQALGKRFAIDETGFKPYPSCRYSHTAIDILLDIWHEIGRDAAGIESVRIGLPWTAIEIIGIPEAAKRAPRSIVDGQFSMYFCAAAALLRGRLGWDEYELLGDAAIARLIERIEVFHDPEAEALYPRMAATVEVRAGGRTIRRVGDTPKGEPEKPVSWEDAIAKFDGLAGSAYSAARRARIVETIRTLERCANVCELTSTLDAPDR